VNEITVSVTFVDSTHTPTVTH